MKKSKWETPKIITLVRSNTEEAVLTFCKGGTKATGSKTKNSNCTSNCVNCSATSTS